MMAHQHLAQLSPSLKEALLANARSRLVFQLSSGDAATQSRELGVNAGDLQHLPAYHAIARLATAQGVSDPVSLATASLPPSLGNARLVRRASQARYRGATQIDRRATAAALRTGVAVKAGNRLTKARVMSSRVPHRLDEDRPLGRAQPAPAADSASECHDRAAARRISAPAPKWSSPT